MDPEALSAVDWNPVAAVITALLGLLGVRLSRTRPSHLRDEIEQDLRILGHLPKMSPQRAELQQSIDVRIGQLAKSSDKRRDRFGMGLGIGLVALAGLTTWWALQGGWWILLWAPIVFFGLTGLVGFFESLPKASRDAQGNQISSGD